VKIGLERNRIYGTPMPEIEESGRQGGCEDTSEFSTNR
jgi:hypothetical protein